MLKGGIHLTLMIGPGVPVPVPRSVLDALISVQVTTAAGHRSPSGFELKFNVSNRSPLHTAFLLSGGSMLPIMRVIIILTMNGTPEVLMDGVITKQDTTPGGAGGQSTVTLSGVDPTALMGLIDFDGFPFPAMTPELRVLAILAKYAFFGIVPVVIPTLLPDFPVPVERIPRQKGKDIEYINQLADEAGYVFYIEAGPMPFMNKGYWGPEIKFGVPQRALNGPEMGAEANIESINPTFDKEAKTLPVVFIHNQLTKMPIPIPVPDFNPLQPPLGLVPPLPLKIEFQNNTAKLSPIQAALTGLAEAARSSDAVTASGSLDVVRYGALLKARKLVGVRGAGPAFDGLYFVKSVTTNIKSGECKQDFTLTRNGLVSITPKVPV
jgi:hypothetical protein